MTVKEMIKILIDQGHKVEFYHRSDGGFVITKIDKQHYTGKRGNAVARKMLGQELSVARRVQLARIRTPKGKRWTKKKPLPKDIKKSMERVQRQWRKKHPTIEGTISTRGVRYQIETYGEEKAKGSIDKAERYAQGLAYVENVEFLIQKIESDLFKDYYSEMDRVLTHIKAKKNNFKEEWIWPIYQEIYEWEKGTIDGKECARRIEEIIS